jgi:hypothetical protein
VKIELLYVPDCPHVDQARHLLQACLTELNLTSVEVAERQGNFPSPSILVNGIDVMGTPASEDASCRLDLPTRARVLSALRREEGSET